MLIAVHNKVMRSRVLNVRYSRRKSNCNPGQIRIYIYIYILGTTRVYDVKFNFDQLQFKIYLSNMFIVHTHGIYYVHDKTTKENVLNTRVFYVKITIIFTVGEVNNTIVYNLS